MLPGRRITIIALEIRGERVEIHKPNGDERSVRRETKPDMTQEAEEAHQLHSDNVIIPAHRNRCPITGISRFGISGCLATFMLKSG